MVWHPLVRLRKGKSDSIMRCTVDYIDLSSLEGKNVLVVDAVGGLAKETC